MVIECGCNPDSYLGVSRNMCESVLQSPACIYLSDQYCDQSQVNIYTAHNIKWCCPLNVNIDYINTKMIIL